MTSNVLRRSGFTLMEVLLALALTTLLVGAVFSFLENLGRRRDELASSAQRSRELATLMDRIEGDLAATVVSDARGGPGVIGKSAEISVLTRRVVARSGRTEGDLSRASYAFDPAEGLIRAGIGVAPSDAPPTEIAAEGVRSLRFRYFDGRAWRSEFESQQAKTLPAAIEIAIWSGERSSAREPVSDAGASTATLGEPDRVRTIVILDGPSAAWKEDR